jgi:PPM family protein phosphatase
MIDLRAGSATDVGLVRTNNQDDLLLASPLFAVADGMGGAAAGEVASATALRALADEFAQVTRRAGVVPSADHLVQAAQAANRAVWEQAEANPAMRGMGTTLVALALVDGGRLAIVNIGDSRLYAMHHDELSQITDDHNLVAELVAQGRLSKEEAEFHPRRNIMTRALGVEPDVPVDLFMLDPEPGDRYLLCSDGLPREVKDEQIASVLRRLADPVQAAQELVDEAIRRGGNDNITVVVVDVVDVVESGAESAGKDDTVAIPAPIPEPPPVAAPEESAAPRRRFGRQRRSSDARRKARPVTFRVVAFLILFLLIVGGAAAAIAWYARSGYFVGLKGQNLAIFKGRPGGVLWWEPTVSTVSSTTTGDIEARHVPDLQAGQQEPSMAAAEQYIGDLVNEKQQAEAAAVPPRSAISGTTTTLAPRRSGASTTLAPRPNGATALGT